MQGSNSPQPLPLDQSPEQDFACCFWYTSLLYLGRGSTRKLVWLRVQDPSKQLQKNRLHWKRSSTQNLRVQKCEHCLCKLFKHPTLLKGQPTRHDTDRIVWHQPNDTEYFTIFQWSAKDVAFNVSLKGMGIVSHNINSSFLDMIWMRKSR